MALYTWLRHHYRPLYAALFIGFDITLFCLLALPNISLFSRVELAAYDYQFGLRGSLATPNQIVVLGVDAATVDDLANGHYPLPRRYVAHALTFLCQKAHVKAVGIDFLYTADSTTVDDRALSRAIKGCGNVVVGQALNGASATSDASTSSLEPPIDPIANASVGLGVVNVPLDPDSVVRSSDPVQPGPQGKDYPSLPLALASVALHRPFNDVIRGLPRNVQRINYVGPQDPGNSGSVSFVTHELEGVARGEDDPRNYRGKIVLIVPYAPEFHDQLETPFGPMYGGVVQANALTTILNRNPIIPVGDINNDLILVILGLATTVLAARFGIYRSVTLVALLAVMYAVFTLLLFQHLRTWVNVVTPETVILFIFTGIMSFRFSTEERQRRKTRKIFGQYVRPEVVDLLVSSPDAEKALAGARRPISVLFADMRGSTTLGEMLEPEQVIQLFDIYLEEVTESVQEAQGTVDKYVGDEIMAIWNAPFFQEDHAFLAVKSALDMIGRSDQINDQLVAKGLPKIRYGVGVNSGDAIVGQMGSSFRKQYDVVGDTVNTAARLCSAAAGGEVIIGENVWKLIGDRLDVEEVESLTLKGKTQALRTFRVIGLRPEGAPVPAMVATPAQ